MCWVTHHNVFMESVYNNLRNNWRWEGSQEEQDKIAEKIAKAFGLTLTSEYIRKYRGNECVSISYLLLMTNRTPCNYFMTINKDANTFTIGSGRPNLFQRLKRYEIE